MVWSHYKNNDRNWKQESFHQKNANANNIFFHHSCLKNYRICLRCFILYRPLNTSDFHLFRSLQISLKEKCCIHHQKTHVSERHISMEFSITRRRRKSWDSFFEHENSFCLINLYTPHSLEYCLPIWEKILLISSILFRRQQFDSS